MSKDAAAQEKSWAAWTFGPHGDPPRRFKVLGIIEDERSGGVIPMAQLKHDIVQKARQNGGNAVIFVSSVAVGSSATAFGVLYDRPHYETQLDICRHSVSRLMAVKRSFIPKLCKAGLVLLRP